MLNTCEVRRGTVARCYCRGDFHGLYCNDTSNYTVKCAVNYIEPSMAKSCNFDTSEYYNYSISGHDPCHFVKDNEKVRVKFWVDCRTEGDKTEGVRVDLPEGRIDETQVLPKYTYYVNTERLLLSYQPQEFYVGMTVINWKYLS